VRSVSVLPFIGVDFGRAMGPFEHTVALERERYTCSIPDCAYFFLVCALERERCTCSIPDFAFFFLVCAVYWCVFPCLTSQASSKEMAAATAAQAAAEIAAADAKAAAAVDAAILMATTAGADAPDNLHLVDGFDPNETSVWQGVSNVRGDEEEYTGFSAVGAANELEIELAQVRSELVAAKVEVQGCQEEMFEAIDAVRAPIRFFVHQCPPPLFHVSFCSPWSRAV
jgi:hypothetical protein